MVQNRLEGNVHFAINGNEGSFYNYGFNLDPKNINIRSYNIFQKVVETARTVADDILNPFVATVTVEDLVKISRKLRFESQIPFVAQVFKHAVIPVEVKQDFIAALFYAETEFETVLLPYQYDDYRKFYRSKTYTDRQKKHNKTILAYVFKNADLNLIFEGYTALAGRWADEEDTVIIVKGLLKNETFEDNFEKIVFYFTEKKIKEFLLQLPSTSESLDLILKYYRIFRNHNFNRENWENLVIKKLRQCDETLEELPDNWIIQLSKTLIKL